MIVRTLPTYDQERDKIAWNDDNIYSDIQELVQTVDDFTDDHYLPTPKLFILSCQTLLRGGRISLQQHRIRFQRRIPLQQYRNEFQG